MPKWLDALLGRNPTPPAQTAPIVTQAADPGGDRQPKRAIRTYAAARSSRLTAGWGQGKSSADSELWSSLTALRERSRALIRDAAFAKNARRVVVNNVIGTGIRMQARVENTRGSQHTSINDQIEAEWLRWCRADSCHTGGVLAFQDLERLAMAQVFDAGECFLRMHFRKFGSSRVPLAIEVIEAERLADEYVNPGGMGLETILKLGIEQDMLGRPVRFWLREVHPADIRFAYSQTDRVFSVPADEMFHIRVIDRWPQTRGEPWLHAAARKLNDMDGYTEAEIVAARGAATYMATIESQDGENYGEEQDDGSLQIELEPGMVERLSPGEKLAFHAPNRPNSGADPFLRFMLREIAAGVGCSFESLSRDYSQSNYSSSRLALIDDRDLWRAIQGWFIRSFREGLHRVWIRQAVLARALDRIDLVQYGLDPEKFEAVAFKPRGWTWVDPTREVAAYKEAIKAGLKTVTDVIAETNGGTDFDEVMTERRRELDRMAELDLDFDTNPDAYMKPAAPSPSPAPAEPAAGDGDEPKNESEEPEKDGEGAPEKAPRRKADLRMVREL